MLTGKLFHADYTREPLCAVIAASVRLCLN